jgi:hypothetical protein
MAVHEFASNVFEQVVTSRPVPGPENKPQIDLVPIGVAQSSDVQGGRHNLYGEPLGTQPEFIQEFLMPGFHALDEAMKTYWSGIRIPTKDSYRFIRVKIAGGDKSILIWRDQLKDGRVKFPVASINRTSHEYNPQKFSTPVLTMARRYTSSRMDRVALIRRPVPFLVKYTLTIWASWKRDADNALEQILTRFNPLADFVMSDHHLQGSVQLRYEGSSDTSEKEAGFDQKAKTRYEFSMTAEAWLPLPELIVPTILGHVNVVRESVTDQLLSVGRGNTTRLFYDPSSDGWNV